MMPPAFDEIYARHAGDVFRSAHAVLRDRELAEDVVQDVFERLWRGAAFDERRGGLGPYLRLMARSRALDLWRRTRAGERTQIRLEDHARFAHAGAQDPEAVFERATRRGLARSAVHRLPAEQRQAIGLAYWGDLTVQEVATRERVPLGTAKSRIRLGLGKLAEDPSVLAA
jgi:RNA polymerase sigma-70 factor, ECF subfamily